MTCFVIVESTPLDADELNQYKAQAAKTVAAFGGKFVARGEIEVLHGKAIHPMKALIEFPDKDTAKSWYHSEDYQGLTAQRERGMQSQFHLL